MERANRSRAVGRWIVPQVTSLPVLRTMAEPGVDLGAKGPLHTCHERVHSAYPAAQAFGVRNPSCHRSKLLIRTSRVPPLAVRLNPAALLSKA